MNTNLKSKDAFDLLQLADKIEHSITPNNESLDQKWYSLVQLHGGVQACVELLRPRKLYINELISFMETIRSISCSIPENIDKQHFVDKLDDYLILQHKMYRIRISQYPFAISLLKNHKMI
jgi:hypothetical protein